MLHSPTPTETVGYSSPTSEQQPLCMQITPCPENSRDDSDMDLFHAHTTVTVGNGAKVSFWNPPWVNGLLPRQIAPSIFTISKRTNSRVKGALVGNAWLQRVDLSGGLAAQHL